MAQTRLEKLKAHIASDHRTKILAFGSSNTERRLPGMHWFDCFELAMHQQLGARAHCINAGIGGDTTRELLARFDTDAAVYQPHAAFLTIGGNDGKPEEGLDLEKFEANLRQIWQRFAEMGTLVIFQTYYAVKSDGSPHFQNFYRNMEVVRRVARDTGSCLIDHLARWEPLRREYPEIYDPLMDDDFHVNARGNRVMGLDIVRYFGWEITLHPDYWSDASRIQRMMDELSGR